MEIYKVKLLKESRFAYHLTWYDNNYKKRIQTWVPKSVCTLENGTLFLDINMYNKLKLQEV